MTDYGPGMKINHKLNALFAEKVLGCTHGSECSGVNCWYIGDDIGDYCTSLDAAWSGVEKVMGLGWHISIEDTDKGAVVVTLWQGLDCVSADMMETESGPFPISQEIGPFPISLVKVCLLAVGVTQEEIDEITNLGQES